MKRTVKEGLKILAGVTALSGAASYVLFYSNMRRSIREEVECIPCQEGENPFREQERAGKKWSDEHAGIRQRLELNREGCRLTGYYFDQGADRSVILVHGIKSYYRNRLADAGTYYERGYNVLSINLRGAGESDGKVYTMGCLDSADVTAWARYLISRRKQKRIVLDGVSMGAATVLTAAGREDLPAEVKGIVADCGFTSIEAITRHLLKDRFHLPLFPFYYFSMLYAKLLLKMNQETPIESVKKAKAPILFIHGAEDDYVPYAMVDELYSACRSEKYVERVQGAGHAMSWKNREQYQGAIRAFLDKVIQKNEKDD